MCSLLADRLKLAKFIALEIYFLALDFDLRVILSFFQLLTKYVQQIRYSSWLFNFKFLKLIFDIILGLLSVFRFPRARFFSLFWSSFFNKNEMWTRRHSLLLWLLSRVRILRWCISHTNAFCLAWRASKKCGILKSKPNEQSDKTTT